MTGTLTGISTITGSSTEAIIFIRAIGIRDTGPPFRPAGNLTSRGFTRDTTTTGIRGTIITARSTGRSFTHRSVI